MSNQLSSKLSNKLILFTFCAWLTTRRGTLKVGECHNSAETCALLQEFIEWNDLECKGEELVFDSCAYPPRLWYRYTPCLGKIEWRIRKVYRDLKIMVGQMLGDPHACP